LADKKTGKACGSPETREYIENVDKLFWGGGDQEKLVAALRLINT